jgi:hypothetical protein
MRRTARGVLVLAAVLIGLWVVVQADVRPVGPTAPYSTPTTHTTPEVPR